MKLLTSALIIPVNAFLWSRSTIYCQYWKSICSVRYRFSALTVNIGMHDLLTVSTIKYN